jgi:hypothetical protein
MPLIFFTMHVMELKEINSYEVCIRVDFATSV